jgi:hypothetical protein
MLKNRYNPLMLVSVAVTAALFGCASPRHTQAAELTGVSPVTDRVLLLSFDDAVTIRHESRGGNGADGQVETAPLDTARAALPESYRVASKDDPAYKAGRVPVKVGRKSKGHDFVNTPGGKVKWAMYHEVYLVLPEPLRRGKTYTISAAGDLAAKGSPFTLTFNEPRNRSETVHVNQIGYVPSAPQKFAYLSHWMGDLGPLSLDEYGTLRFRLLEAKTGKEVFSGPVSLRKRAAEADGGQADEAGRNYPGADVWQCDFSAFKMPGEYVVSVDRVGCSFPFLVGTDVYRQAYRTVARGLYHQRCGTVLTAKHTEWTRDACHLPDAAHPLQQTDHRYLDRSFGDGPPKDARFNLTGENRTVQGGWHDAGDWDRENWHLPAATTLLLAYELAPDRFSDGELNLPESGNGVPDLVDEARWCIDYYKRLQRPDGGVSVGMFEESFPKIGWTSVTDPMKRYVYAEDPQATYRYAAAASHLAWCLRRAGKATEADDYVASARRAWDWAGKNLKQGDEAKLRDDRFHAAVALYRATGGEAPFLEAFRRDLQIDTPEAMLYEWGKRDQQMGVWTFLLTDQKPGADAALTDRLRRAALHFADAQTVGTAARRAGRYGYDWYVPMWWGSATIPRTLPAAVAYRLSADPKYLAVQYTTSDYMLGGNPLNTVWVTGLGKRHPREVMRWDSWYHASPPPGIIPFGPTRFAPDPVHGPWEPQFAQATCYPEAKQWPAHELYFETRLCPPTNEFTVGSLAEAAAAYGLLCAPAPAAKPVARR